MALQLYNTLTRGKQKFQSLVKGKVGLYTCGPTVYWTQHIGNMRCYVADDILRRMLEYIGYEVMHVMNITDVGHLTGDNEGDADLGHDKMEASAVKEGKTVWEIADFYTAVFREDMKQLHIMDPKVWCKVTDHILEQVEWIKKLEDRGFTYKTSDGIYYDTSKFPTYADFARLDVAGLQAGHRTDMRDKRNVTDFALWKFSVPEDKRQMEWDSPWGRGFPGWHIECTAMSAKYLGSHFDIHWGGVDHISTHHTNEIAQAEPVVGGRWVNYWMHSEFLQVEGAKMSKSLGNVFTIEDIRQKGHHPLAFRYLCLQAHYKKQMNFTWKSLEAAEKALKRWWAFIDNLEGLNTTAPNSIYVPKLLEESKLRFVTAMEDDLNVPEALGSVFDFMTEVNKLILKRSISKENVEQVLLQMKKFDSIFGILEHETKDIDPLLIHLIEKRERARERKDFSESDRLRDELMSKGIVLEDTPDGVRWKRK